MYQLNYLSILLILLAFFIFYNEFNKKLSIADMCLLAIAFIAILRASYNYIQLDNSLNLNKKNEGFANKRTKSKSKRLHNHHNDEGDNDNSFMNVKSEDSTEYLDIETENNNAKNKNIIQNLKYINNDNNDNNNDNDIDNDIDNLINKDAVNNIDALLGIGIHNKEMFEDTLEPESKDEIKSMFAPKIIIGKNNDDDFNRPSRWNNVFSGNEFNYNNSGNGGGSSGGGNNNDNNDNDNDGSDGNKCDGSNTGGVGNGNSYGSMSSDNDIAKYTDKKRCGKYDNIREDDDGSMVVQNYGDAKTWYPGYTYLPPSNWDVPQKYPPVCIAPSPDTIKLTGLVDRGLPLNVLELNPYNGKIAKTENSVHLTNVGSMLPKFRYEEQPFSKPYI